MRFAGRHRCTDVSLRRDRASDQARAHSATQAPTPGAFAGAISALHRRFWSAAPSTSAAPNGSRSGAPVAPAEINRRNRAFFGE